MFITSIKKQDSFTVETKIFFKSVDDKRNTKYFANTYIFIPESLEINKYSYLKNDFYNKLKVNIRLKTPIYSLNLIADKLQEPYAKLARAVDSLLSDPSKQILQKYEFQIKIYCLVYGSASRELLLSVAKLSSKETVKKIELFIDFSTKILANYRELRKIISDSNLSEIDKQKFYWGDEFLSNTIERHSFKFAEFIKYRKKLNSKFKHLFVELIAKEQDYRKKQKYQSVVKENSDNEIVLYRRNILKKYVESMLFLQKSVKREGVWLEQFLFAIAAGLAMIFSTGIAFYYQSVYGSITIPVFLALVIGYMFKDRIKEWGRAVFSKKISGMFYDYKTKIYSNKHHKIGTTKDSFRFIKRENLPNKVKKIKDKIVESPIETSLRFEKIIEYKKYVKINSSRIKRLNYMRLAPGLVDVTRINMIDFTLKMAEPRKVLVSVKNNDFQKSYGDRVYFINMIQEYGLLNEKPKYANYLIIMNKNGIKRIENLDKSSR